MSRVPVREEVRYDEGVGCDRVYYTYMAKGGICREVNFPLRDGRPVEEEKAVGIAAIEQDMENLGLSSKDIVPMLLSESSKMVYVDIDEDD